jgi:hypothetical protein
MRTALLVLTCAFLAGCPVYLKVYIHNDSDNSIHVESLRAQNTVTIIRAGRAKTIQTGSVDDVCFELSVGGDVRIYSIDPNSGPYIKSTAFGGRLDFHFGGDGMYVRSNTGERLEIFGQAQCVE